MLRIKGGKTGAVERSETEGLSFSTFAFEDVFILPQLQSLRVCYANPPPFTQGRLFSLKLFAKFLIYTMQLTLLMFIVF